MRAEINPPRLREVGEGTEELRKALGEWKKLDSSVLLGILDGIKSSLLEPLQSMSFEAGVKFVTGTNNLSFRPSLEWASYYQSVECRPKPDPALSMFLHLAKSDTILHILGALLAEQTVILYAPTRSTGLYAM